MSRINCIAALKALSEILRLLLREKLGVNDVSRRLKVSPYNVSKHLRILREAGLLHREKLGKQRFYAVAPALEDRLAENKNVLAMDCCTVRFDKLPQ